MIIELKTRGHDLTPITFKVPDALWRKLLRRLAKDGVTPDAWMRHALGAWLKSGLTIEEYIKSGKSREAFQHWPPHTRRRRTRRRA